MLHTAYPERVATDHTEWRNLWKIAAIGMIVPMMMIAGMFLAIILEALRFGS